MFESEFQLLSAVKPPPADILETTYNISDLVRDFKGQYWVLKYQRTPGFWEASSKYGNETANMRETEFSLIIPYELPSNVGDAGTVTSTGARRNRFHEELTNCSYGRRHPRNNGVFLPRQ